MGAMYCLPSDIRENVGGTDAGTGTCAALEDYQLNAAIAQASAKVSAYAGTTYVVDAADPVVVVPDLVKTCTVQIATYYATLTYRKGKDMSAFDPVYLGYEDAMKTLTDVVNGWIEIDPSTPGEPVVDAGHVVQTIPRIFDHQDSGTVINPLTRRIEPEGAPGRGWDGGWG
jgi:phage gp36-like protein